MISEAGTGHVPVLLRETLEALAVGPGGLYVDATVGLGGHAEAILSRLGPEGRLVGLDRDEAALAKAAERLAPFGDRVRLRPGNFSEIAAAVEEGSASGVMADLGVSSLQLDTPERGFSFQRAGALDMRMDPGRGPTAAEWLAQATEEELEERLRAAGEERFARRLARGLKRFPEPWRTTDQLARAVSRWLPRRGRTHPATRVFLALRMAVNEELEGLEKFLESARRVLRPGGRLAVITFHSAEDRIVKLFGREWKDKPGGLRALFKKPVVAGAEERRSNPRSRSAKLRAYERI